MQRQIRCYADFVSALLEAGFSMGGGNDGIYSVLSWGWEEEPPYPTPVRWHTGDPETDPWEWRMRVLNEREDIAYAKVFFKKSGYITREWIPCFLAARRGGRTLAEEYEDGIVSAYAKRIYEAVREYETLPLHAIAPVCGYGKEEKPKIERALVELQMKLYLTMCGRQRKVSRMGEEYGWSSTVFCTAERFWGEAVFEEAARLVRQDAAERIARRVLALNPDAEKKKIEKFILG
ncbi:MAG TPA: hypothetical protein VN540_04845 [Clostridia bacterium]|nr:hypothetical protein [Clostridia bacterium]